MDRYRSLYKENSSMLSPAQHSRANRDLQNANRAKNRRQIFQSGRNFDVSPTPRKVSKPQQQVVQLENKNAEENVKTEILTDTTNTLKTKEQIKSQQNVGNVSRIALVASGKTNSKKVTKQESYLLKFIQWKEAQKEKEKKRNEPKRRPFVPSGGCGGNTFSNSSQATRVIGSTKNKEVAAFVPKGHTNFKPPVGLQNSMLKMTSAARDVLANDRKSFYTAVPTPPKTKQDNKNVKTPAVPNSSRFNANATPAIGTVKLTKPPTTSKSKNINGTSTKVVGKISTIARTASKPTAVVAPNKNMLLGRALTYPPSSTTTAASGLNKQTTKPDNKLGIKEPIKNSTNTVIKNDANANLPVNRLNIVHKFTRPQPPKLKANITRKPVSRPNTISGTCTSNNIRKPSTTGITTGAVGKAHALQDKQAAALQSNQHRNAKFATSFKSKKTQVAKTFNRPNAPSKLTIKGKTLLGGGVRTCATDAAFAFAETPTDLLNINPYEPFITSTRVKSLSPHTNNAPNLSPINKEVDIAPTVQQNHQYIRTHSSSMAKRTLLPNQVQTKPSNMAQNPPNQIQRQKSKFNFIRYSVGLSELDTSNEAGISRLEFDEVEKEVDDVKSKHQVTVLEKQPRVENVIDNSTMPHKSGTNSEYQLQNTPTTKESERPVNYVGSFVSVSRGKVSARKERANRNSIYVPSIDVTLVADEHTTPIKTQTDVEAISQATATTPISIESRRMLEAVRYFRLQLNNEIERLHALCDQWEEYKTQNLQLLQQTGGEDMINVTIGQTKLLTSKKFQQFRGLIDRCESGARGTAAVSDGSEDTKPISDVDLEGFWSMLNLQVDNIEKRFENLTRWKSNNWSDPEDVPQINKETKPKVKTNLTKVKKAKAPAKTAKASSGLQAMLRKMHAEMRKNKQNTPTTDVDTAAETLILTPTRQRQRRSHSGTPTIQAACEQRVSVVVRDRKSLSAAATVVSIPADSAVVSAVSAQRRLSRLIASTAPAGDSPKSLRAIGNELRRSINNMEKAFGGCNDLLRATLTGNVNKVRRRSGTPTFVESILDTKQEKPQEQKQQYQEQQVRTPSPQAPMPMPSRKSILKTPGTAKGKSKNVIFSEKLRVKKFKFTLEDDKLSDEEELRMQTSTEEPLNDQRTYSLRTRKVILRPSSEFEIP